jgi:hypothetical protein
MPDGAKSDVRLPEPRPGGGEPPAPALGRGTCPECGAEVAPAGLEAHLRQAHRPDPFRGAGRTPSATVAALLAALAAPHPDPKAWRTLSDIALQEQGAHAGPFLAELLGQALGRLGGATRATAVEALAPVLAAGANPSLVAALASDGEPAARHLALAVLGRLPGPPDGTLVQPLRALLLDRRLPEEAQLAAMAAVLRGAGGDSAVAAELLRTLVSGLGKARSIERLRRLRDRAGKSPALDALCAQLEDQLRLSCPRCQAQLRRPEMIRHLWEEHRLVLDGRRVRDPWAVVEDRVHAYQPGAEPELLERCRVVAQRLDPAQGLLRLQRLLLARGVSDPDVRDPLLREARAANAARCPGCFALVPVPPELPPLAVNHRPGRLSARGYSVEVSERGPRTFLEVRGGPGRLLYRGREPGRLWAPRGAALVLAAPLVLVALAWACGLIDPGGTPLGPVAALLTAALVVYHTARAWWRLRPPPAERVLHYAWTLLAPRLHADGFVLEDSAFLAGLARLAPSAQHAAERAALWPGLLKRTEAAVAAGAAPASHLAALCRLQLADASAEGEDPVPLLVARLARCALFAEGGRLPLAFAEGLLAGWQAGWWTPGHRARLRILLCDRAFEAGFEVQNLVDAGRDAPALGSLLGCADPQGLAALRLLWSLRPGRPWDRCGPAVTAFELAADPRWGPLLVQYPDLLLRQEEPNLFVVADGGKGKMAAAQVLVRGEGVMLQEVLFREAPRVVEVRVKLAGCELVLGEGERVFRSPDNLEELSLRLERWCRYLFHEFRPALAGVRNWRPPDRAALLRAWGAVRCPECRRPLLARVGEVGVALESSEGGGEGPFG